jgi:hypothetical protein
LSGAANLKPGNIVAMDNLPAHQNDDVRRIIEAAGAFVVPILCRQNLSKASPAKNATIEA